MQKITSSLFFCVIICFSVQAQKYNGIDANMGNIFLMSDAKTRSISPENFNGAKGEGGVGPNLTDDYWLHKGSLNDVYRTIKVGYPDKGMQSWASKFSPKEMSQLASYVKALKGTNPPNGKTAQGDLFTDTAATDSLNTNKTDSLKITGLDTTKVK